MRHFLQYNQKVQHSFHNRYQELDNHQVNRIQDQQVNVQAHFMDQFDMQYHRFDQIPHVWVHHNQYFLHRQMSHLKQILFIIFLLLDLPSEL